MPLQADPKFWTNKKKEIWVLHLDFQQLADTRI